MKNPTKRRQRAGNQATKKRFKQRQHMSNQFQFRSLIGPLINLLASIINAISRWGF